jgi:succinoglycan biosynthesis protein ExoM
MTDDDCVPDRRWISEMIACQHRTEADAVAGRFVRRAPADAPRWIREHGVLDHGVTTYPVDSAIAVASTHNSMISAAWLREHPDVRFDPDYGRVGGEDMVFFHTARANGMRIRYTPEAIVYEDEPPERLSFRYLTWQALWLGNSSFVTSVEGRHVSRSRMALHGSAEVMRGLLQPFSRVFKRQAPAFRYGITQAAGGLGTLLGAFGVRLRHH